MKRMKRIVAVMLTVCMFFVSSGITDYVSAADAYTGTPKFYSSNGSSGFYFTSEDGITALGWNKFFHDLEGEANGIFVNGTKIEDSQANLQKTEGNIWYVGLGSGSDGLQAGDVVTVKGQFQLENADTLITFTSASFVYDGTTYKQTYVGTPKFYSSNGSSGFYFTSEDGITALGWNKFFHDLEGETNGIFVNGTKIEDSQANLQKTEGNIWYVGLGSGSDGLQAGDVVTVKGQFQLENADTLITFTSASFVYDGTKFAEKSEEPPTYTGKPVFNSSKGVAGFYFTAGESEFPYDVDWRYNSYAADGDENGVLLNGTKTSVFLKKVQPDLWYVCMSDASVVPTKGDVITVKGSFIYDNAYRMTFSEAKFIWDGTQYKAYVEYEEYTGTPVFNQTGNGNAGFYFTAGETEFPYDESWGYNSYAADGDENGVLLNGTKTSVFLKKVQADLWYVCMNDASVTPAKGDIITVKGSFIYDDAHRMTFSEAKFTWDGSQYKTYEESTNYTGTPVLSETEEYGKAAGFYFTSEDGAPYAGDWSLNFTALDGDDNGVFVNGTKTAIILKKVGTNLWYVCIGDANVTLNYGDVVTIKGTFRVGDTSDTVTFNEASFEFNGKRFGEGEFTATDFTITGLAYSDIVYDTANSRWNMYFTLSTNIPGGIDDTYYPYMSYDINGTVYETHWFRSSSAHTVGGETIYNLYIPIKELPKTLDKEYVITVKAGASQGRDSKNNNAARQDGIRLTEDYQFTVGGDYEASAPTIDYLSSNGGDKNGIYLSSQDLFPTIGWDYNLTKVSTEDGIVVDGATTDVYIKKYADNKYYVCLSDMGVNVSEGTIVMIRGAFTTAGLNKVTFKTAKYIFTNNQWNAYIPSVESEESTGVYGNANKDDNKELNSADLIRIKRHLKGLEDDICLVDADLNGTGNIDEKDVVLERKLLIGLIDENGAHIKGAPTYTNTEDEMRLAAYSGPTADGFKDYKDAGFTTLISEHVAVYGTEGFAEYMRAAESAGLDVLVQSGYMQGMLDGTEKIDQAWLQSMYNDLKGYKSFRGMYMADEPVIANIEYYRDVAKALKTMDPDMDLFTSLHPLYVPNESYISADTSLSLYEKYTNYIKAYGDALNEISYDFYPFRHYNYRKWDWGSFSYKQYDENRMRPDWFNNLTMVASAARGHYNSSITVQSYAEPSVTNNEVGYYRNVTEADVSFQVYSALAYGMKSINYFTYNDHWNSSVNKEAGSAMIYNGEKTGVYTAVQNVNKEIKALDHMLLKYTWQGTIGITGDNADRLFDYADYYDYDSKRISTYTATNDAIIGCLRDVDGYDGFMLVNATDPSDNITETISVTFKSADHAKVYIDGVESIVELTNGVYKTTLKPGQGVFVIPYME